MKAFAFGPQGPLQFLLLPGPQVGVEPGQFPFLWNTMAERQKEKQAISLELMAARAKTQVTVRV
jgi:hypothetical protein